MKGEKEYLSSALYWYPRLWGLPTPRTAIALYDHQESIGALEGEESDYELPVSEVQALAAEVGYPVFIRTDMASAKHDGPAAYRADGPEDIDGVLWATVEDNEMKFWLGVESPRAFLIREWIDVQHSFKAFGGFTDSAKLAGGHPIGQEWRLFANGKTKSVECEHYYWPEESMRFYGTDEPKDWKQKLADLAAQGFPPELNDWAITAARRCWHHPTWSVDFALDEAGKWWLIDMAIAEQSWHPEHGEKS